MADKKKQNSAKNLKQARAQDDLTVIKMVLDDNPPLRDRVVTLLRRQLGPLAEKAVKEAQEQAKAKAREL